MAVYYRLAPVDSPPQPSQSLTRQASGRFYEQQQTYILKSHVSFGGGIILIGNDRERKNLMPRPNVTKTLDGVGRPSPLVPETSYIGVRHLQKEEVQKLEGHKYSPKIQERADDVKEIFRPADTLDHEKWHDSSQPPIRTDSDINPEKMFANMKEMELEKRQQLAAFPIMTSKMLYNQYCENMMDDGPKTPALMTMNRKWGAKRRWLKELPPNINSAPIFTIRVRWKMSPNLPTYNLELVHALLSRHGRIISTSQVSTNSTMVVFSDVETARRALRCCKGVGSSYPLICSWWFPEMASYNKMIHEQRSREEKRVWVQLNESTILRMEFKKIQEKCMIQFKKHQGGLSYDRSTFVP